MNARNHFQLGCKIILAGLFTLALSCTDHQIPDNLPESKCKAVDGSDRLYPCEFIIEKITFLAKDGSDLGFVTGSLQNLGLSRFQAKSNTYLGSAVGGIGAATFDIRITLKRVANPSFPVNEGYLLGYTHNTSGKLILHTPSFLGDTYGERTKFGSTFTLNMAIGESRDVVVDMVFPYRMEDLGPAGIKPVTVFSSTSFFIDNDVTTLKFARTLTPYNSVGSVVEAYIEKLSIGLTN